MLAAEILKYSPPPPPKPGGLVRSAVYFFCTMRGVSRGERGNVRRGGKELYTRNDGVMGCEVGFAGFASKDFVRVEVDVVREPHGGGDSDFAVVVGRSR